MEYPWPGNARELQNLVERLVIMADQDVVTLKDLPCYMSKDMTKVDHLTFSSAFDRELPLSLKEIERQKIEEALKSNNWIQAKAARELGLTQRQIGYRIKKYAIRLPKRSSQNNSSLPERKIPLSISG